MSKSDDGGDEYAKAPNTKIELLKPPIPMAPPSEPYRRDEGRFLGKNETNAETTPEAKKAEPTAEFRIAMLTDDKGNTPKPAEKKSKETEPQNRKDQASWVQRIGPDKKPYNEDTNNKALGRSLHEFKPAATSISESSTSKQPSETLSEKQLDVSEKKSPQPPKQSFIDQLRQTPPAPKSTPPSKGR